MKQISVENLAKGSIVTLTICGIGLFGFALYEIIKYKTFNKKVEKTNLEFKKAIEELRNILKKPKKLD